MPTCPHWSECFICGKRTKQYCRRCWETVCPTCYELGAYKGSIGHRWRCRAPDPTWDAWHIDSPADPWSPLQPTSSSSSSWHTPGADPRSASAVPQGKARARQTISSGPGWNWRGPNLQGLLTGPGWIRSDPTANIRTPPVRIVTFAPQTQPAPVVVPAAAPVAARPAYHQPPPANHPAWGGNPPPWLQAPTVDPWTLPQAWVPPESRPTPISLVYHPVPPPPPGPLPLIPDRFRGVFRPTPAIRFRRHSF